MTAASAHIVRVDPAFAPVVEAVGPYDPPAPDGTVPLERIDALPDDEVVARLSTIRGIGRWTAQMFLMFQLRRPDIWPVDDYGVRKGFARIHELAEPPKPKALDALGEVYRPYRSTAAWYCWRAVETVLPTA